EINTTDKYSAIKVSFGQKFLCNLFIWNKEISNKNDYLDLYNITSTYNKGDGKWLIVGSSLIHDDGKDLWKQFQTQTGKNLRKDMPYSNEYEIIDILKKEYSCFYAKNINIEANQKDLFVHYFKSNMDGESFD
ncbi:25504_t:CDS:1, partial [Gigaspora margarita]